LSTAGITTREVVDARKERIGPEEALELIGQASRLIVARGKKVLTFNPSRGSLDEDEVLKAVIGPSGNLRAPAIRRGKTLLIGFNEEAFEKAL